MLKMLLTNPWQIRQAAADYDQQFFEHFLRS